MTGLPRSSGRSRCSTAAKNASRSTWRIARTVFRRSSHRRHDFDRMFEPVRRPRRPPPRSALGLDDDRHLGCQAAVDLDRDLVRPERLERLLEIDLVAVDLDAAAGQGVADVLRGDRAVELAALADLHAHRERRGRDPRRRDLGILALALALVLAAGDVVLPGTVG